METRKTSVLPVNQDLSSVYFSLAKFVNYLSLAMFWRMTYTHKLPKLCSATFKAETHAHRILMKVD